MAANHLEYYYRRVLDQLGTGALRTDPPVADPLLDEAFTRVIDDVRRCAASAPYWLSSHEADDVASEVMLVVLTKGFEALGLGRQDPGVFRAWVVGVARHKCADVIRANRRGRNTARAVSEDCRTADPAVAPGGSTDVDWRTAVDRLQEAGALTALTAARVRCYFENGQSCTAAAPLAGVSIATVSRAVKAFETALARLGP